MFHPIAAFCGFLLVLGLLIPTTANAHDTNHRHTHKPKVSAEASVAVYGPGYSVQLDAHPQRHAHTAPYNHQARQARVVHVHRYVNDSCTCGHHRPAWAQRPQRVTYVRHTGVQHTHTQTCGCAHDVRHEAGVCRHFARPASRPANGSWHRH